MKRHDSFSQGSIGEVDILHTCVGLKIFLLTTVQKLSIDIFQVTITNVLPILYGSCVYIYTFSWVSENARPKNDGPSKLQG